MNLVSNRLAFLVSVLKAREARIVGYAALEEIFSRASSVAEAVDLLKGTDLGDFLASRGADSFDLVDELLWEYLGGYFREICSLRPHPPAVRIAWCYLEKYDTANIISALRAALGQGSASLVPVGTLSSLGLLEGLSRAQGPAEVTSLVTQAGMIEYALPIRAMANVEPGTLQQVERRLESLYLKRLGQALAGTDAGQVLTTAHGMLKDRDVLGDLVRRAASGTMARVDLGGDFFGGYLLTPRLVRDLAAMKAPEIARRLVDTPYRSLGRDLAGLLEQHREHEIDRLLDQHLLERLQGLLSPRPLSVTAVLWHLMLKENEIRGVRIALKSVQDRLPPAEVREYLAEAV
ncbi:MAG: V-type ATPase subunit [Desulfomonilia bacterium]|jgi:vacuolar-type H+-ATPase subunit C/Vma6